MTTNIEKKVQDLEGITYQDIRWQRMQTSWYDDRRPVKPINNRIQSEPSKLEKKRIARWEEDCERLEDAATEILEQYGISKKDHSRPFINYVDEQYERLQEKSTDVVHRFYQFNKKHKDSHTCLNFLPDTYDKPRINYHACKRVLKERNIEI